MNTNQNLKLTQQATAMAFKKLTSSLAAASSIPTQKRALSFLKPAALTQAQSGPATNFQQANDPSKEQTSTRFFNFEKIMLSKEESYLMTKIKMNQDLLKDQQAML